jgi:hypothetical protein
MEPVVDDLVNAIRSIPSSIPFRVIGEAGVPDVDIAQFQAAITAKGVQFQGHPIIPLSREKLSW